MAKPKQKFFFAKEIALFMFIVVAFILSCGVNTHIDSYNKWHNTLYSTLGTIDIHDIKKNDTIMLIIRNYIKDNPQYNTFAIIELPIAKLEGNNSTGIFIGPGYKSLYNDIYYGKVLDTISIEQVRTYLISNKYQNHIIKDNWYNTNPIDSITIGNYYKRVSYYAYENFLWRALYVYKKNREYKSIYRLDSLLFIKEVPPSITFKRPVINE